MSTTLSVLHVLMASPGRGAGLTGGGGGVLLAGGGGLPALDPLLTDFWSSFPCPPPWNHALLFRQLSFRVNWTACVGQSVGERLKWLLATRCNIPHDGTGLLPGVDSEGDGDTGEGEGCSAPCVMMIALACLIFCLLTAALVFCLCRKRPKHSSPTYHSSLCAHSDTAKYYTSCHYASAPVLARPLETRWYGGNRTETRVRPGKGDGSPYHHHLHQHHSHHQSPYHQPPDNRPLVTPQHASRGHAHYGTSQAHLNPVLVTVSLNGQTSVVRHCDVPSLVPADPGAPGPQAGDYASSSAASHTYSDHSHTYETIGEGLGLGLCPERGHVSVKCVGGECVCPEYGQHRAPSSCLSYSSSGGAAERAGRALGFSTDGLESDPNGEDYGGRVAGYWSDYDAQTLPMRRFRHMVKGDQECPSAGFYSFDAADCWASGARSVDGEMAGRSRRRLSACGEGGKKSGGRPGVTGHVAALHPNYFDPPEPPAPDTFKA